MFDLLGGMLSSAPGGDTEDGEEEPQEEEPEFVDDTEFVRWRPPAGGMPWASLLFTFIWEDDIIQEILCPSIFTWDPFTPNVGRPIVSAGFEFFPLFFCLLFFCFSPSLPEASLLRSLLCPWVAFIGGTQFKSFLRCPWTLQFNLKLSRNKVSSPRHSSIHKLPLPDDSWAVSTDSPAHKQCHLEEMEPCSPFASLSTAACLSCRRPSTCSQRQGCCLARAQNTPSAWTWGRQKSKNWRKPPPLTCFGYICHCCTRAAPRWRGRRCARLLHRADIGSLLELRKSICQSAAPPRTRSSQWCPPGGHPPPAPWSSSSSAASFATGHQRGLLSTTPSVLVTCHQTMLPPWQLPSLVPKVPTDLPRVSHTVVTIVPSQNQLGNFLSLKSNVLARRRSRTNWRLPPPRCFHFRRRSLGAGSFEQQRQLGEPAAGASGGRATGTSSQTIGKKALNRFLATLQGFPGAEKGPRGKTDPMKLLSRVVIPSGRR